MLSVMYIGDLSEEEKRTVEEFVRSREEFIRQAYCYLREQNFLLLRGGAIRIDSDWKFLEADRMSGEAYHIFVSVERGSDGRIGIWVYYAVSRSSDFYEGYTVVAEVRVIDNEFAGRRLRDVLGAEV